MLQSIAYKGVALRYPPRTASRTTSHIATPPGSHATIQPNPQYHDAHQLSRGSAPERWPHLSRPSSPLSDAVSSSAVTRSRAVGFCCSAYSRSPVRPHRRRWWEARYRRRRRGG